MEEWFIYFKYSHKFVNIEGSRIIRGNMSIDFFDKICKELNEEYKDFLVNDNYNLGQIVIVNLVRVR